MHCLCGDSIFGIYMKINTYEEIINSVSKEKFIVYGKGAHADKFLHFIRRLGFGDNYLYSVVSRKRENTNDCLIQNVNRNQLVIVAAHDKNSKEMEQTLKELGFKNYYLIYPHLIEFGCGLPYKKNVDMNVSEFLKDCLYGNYLSIIYLAIDDIVNSNGIGCDLYIKYMNIYSHPDTSKKRLETLVDRVSHISECYEPEPYNIKVNPKECFLLDGSHRTILAKYFGIDILKADLYDISFEQYDLFYGGGVYLSDEALSKYFCQDECELIINTRINKLGQKS